MNVFASGTSIRSGIEENNMNAENKPVIIQKIIFVFFIGI
jgi:hypothetical protein